MNERYAGPARCFCCFLSDGYDIYIIVRFTLGSLLPHLSFIGRLADWCCDTGLTAVSIRLKLKLKRPGLEMQVRSLFTISNHGEVSAAELCKGSFTYLNGEKPKQHTE